MMKKLYLFDFDGTLTDKDTMFLYLRFFNPSKYRVQFLKHVPLFILLKLTLADAEKVKKRGTCFKNCTLYSFYPS